MIRIGSSSLSAALRHYCHGRRKCAAAVIQRPRGSFFPCPFPLLPDKARSVIHRFRSSGSSTPRPAPGSSARRRGFALSSLDGSRQRVRVLDTAKSASVGKLCINEYIHCVCVCVCVCVCMCTRGLFSYPTLCHSDQLHPLGTM